jgi:hypothetical protein
MDDAFPCKWYCTCSESQYKYFLFSKLLEIHSLKSNFCFTRHTDIPAGNSGYRLYSSRAGEVHGVVCTEHSRDKFNIVHFLYNYSISTVRNTNLSHNAYLFLRYLSASVFGHLHVVCSSFDVCSLYVDVFGNSLII